MRFRSSVRVLSLSRTPLGISFSIHGFFALALLIALWPRSTKLTVPLDVYYNDPKPALAPQLDLAKPIEKKPPPPSKKAVFGLSQKSLTSSAPDAPSDVAVKAGNTVAKEQDNLKLDPNDSDSIPIPTDDFLVSEMPRLLGDIRIAYPPEAKKAGIEGAVLMDLLIDAEGTVRQVTLISGPGSGLDEAAVEAAKKFKFRPGKVKEQAVAVKIRYAYRFVLER